MCLPVTNSNLTGQLENQHTVLRVNSFQGDECLYLLSPARGKSAPVWRDSLRTDCAFDCLICAEVAADLMGPLLLWSWDPVWNFSSPADRDWHESDLRMYYSVSGPSSPSISPSCCLGVVSHWFQSLQRCLAGSSLPDILSWTFAEKRNIQVTQCGSNAIDMINASCQTL